MSGAPGRPGSACAWTGGSAGAQGDVPVPELGRLERDAPQLVPVPRRGQLLAQPARSLVVRVAGVVQDRFCHGSLPIRHRRKLAMSQARSCPGPGPVVSSKASANGRGPFQHLPWAEDMESQSRRLACETGGRTSLARADQPPARQPGLACDLGPLLAPAAMRLVTNVQLPIFLPRQQPARASRLIVRPGRPTAASCTCSNT